jgi:hypothetical protein
MIRRLLVVVVAALALTACGGSPEPPDDERVATDAAALESDAVAIVRGSIGSVDADGDYTVAQFAVGPVAKGDIATGETIEVGYWPAVSPGLRPGSEYVLLLRPADDGQWNLVNSTQGYYMVNSGVPLADFDNPVELSPDVRTKLDLG